jgi:hypothetical protein
MMVTFVTCETETDSNDRAPWGHGRESHFQVVLNNNLTCRYSLIQSKSVRPLYSQHSLDWGHGKKSTGGAPSVPFLAYCSIMSGPNCSVSTRPKFWSLVRFVATNIPANRMARRLEGKYPGGSSVIDRERCGGVDTENFFPWLLYSNIDSNGCSLFMWRFSCVEGLRFGCYPTLL